MSKEFNSENDSFDDSYEDSFFDDAILEIANEITQINAINTAVSPVKSDPQLTLKVEMELKKAEVSSTNIFQILRTLQEVQVYSGNIPLADPRTQITTERKYIHTAKGSDQKYHPLTITETITQTVVASEDVVDYQNLTLEDLFEDPEPDDLPSVVALQKKKSLDPSSLIQVSGNQPQLKSDENHFDTPAIKTVNIPDTISKNITQRLRENEKDIFKNLLKMQKK